MSKPDLPASAPLHFVKGRGAGSNVGSRFDRWAREPDPAPPDEDESDTGTHTDTGTGTRQATVVIAQPARSIISRNDSPDLPFDQSINPYQGCEHGCIYCYARPSHAYLGLSPGLDFETRIFAKSNAADLLRAELGRPGYRPSLVALGANTDPYQPAERRLAITRSVLQVLADCRLPVGITTKSALVTRDIDLLAPMAAQGLVRVFMSIGTLDAALARTLEPRANSPARRLAAIRALTDAGIPVGVFTSPIIPAINDREMEKVLQAAAESGATLASYVLLRLPLEVRDLFVEWLTRHFPDRAGHVMSLVRQMRGGQDYDADFATRMKGSGVYADLLAQRFRIATQRLGLQTRQLSRMDASAFRPPTQDAAQQRLF